MLFPRERYARRERYGARVSRVQPIGCMPEVVQYNQSCNTSPTPAFLVGRKD